LPDRVPAVGAESQEDVPRGPSHACISFSCERGGERGHDARSQCGAQLSDLGRRRVAAVREPRERVTQDRPGRESVDGRRRELGDRVRCVGRRLAPARTGQGVHEPSRPLEVAGQGQIPDVRTDRVGDVPPPVRI
jgi:hypothetical protein